MAYEVMIGRYDASALPLELYFAEGRGAPAVEWNGSSPATPWNSKTTTPFEIALNSVTGQPWSPMTAAPQYVFGTAPNGSRTIVLDRVPELITETIPIQIRGTTLSACFEARHVLRRFLDGAHHTGESYLQIRQPGAGAYTYFRIVGGHIEDDAAYFNNEEPYGRLLRCRLVLIRQPYGRPSTGETILSASAFTNTSTSTNLISLGTSGLGELVWSGQPMNISVTVSSVTVTRTLLASVISRQVDSTGYTAGVAVTTNTSVGVGTLGMQALIDHPHARARLLVRLASISSAEITVKAQLAWPSGAGVFHEVDLSGTSQATTATGRLVDFGDVPIPLNDITGLSGTQTLNVTILATAVSGSPTVTVGYIEILLYHEFCQIDATYGNGPQLSIQTYGGRVIFAPHAAPIALIRSSGIIRDFAQIIGTVPKYRYGTSLWIAVLSGTTHATSTTGTVTADQLPLYETLRGE